MARTRHDLFKILSLDAVASRSTSDRSLSFSLTPPPALPSHEMDDSDMLTATDYAASIFGPEEEYAQYIPLEDPALRVARYKVVHRICDDFEQLSYDNSPNALYCRGIELSKSTEKVMLAIDLLALAASMGHVEATFNLGYMYYQCADIQDLSLAERFLRQAIDLGSLNAICALGDVCEKQGKQQEAYDTYLRAAELGHIGALTNLGTFLVDREKPAIACRKLRSYETDTDPAAKEKTAVTYFTKAAEEGDPGALFNLGWAYLNGIWGVTKDLSEALKYFEASKQCYIAVGKRLDASEAESYITRIRVEVSASPTVAPRP